MKFLGSTMFALGALFTLAGGAIPAFAQTRPTLNMTPLIIQQQQQLQSQQMQQQSQSAIQGMVHDNAVSQQRLSDMSRRNQEALDKQAAPLQPAPSLPGLSR